MTRLPTYHVYIGETRPALGLFLRQDTELLAGLDSGYSFELKLATLAGEIVVTKTAGITGQTGSGAPPLGTPNVVVEWDGELAALEPGTYRAQLKLTDGSGGVRYYQWLVQAHAVL